MYCATHSGSILLTSPNIKPYGHLASLVSSCLISMLLLFYCSFLWLSCLCGSNANKLSCILNQFHIQESSACPNRHLKLNTANDELLVSFCPPYPCKQMSLPLISSVGDTTTHPADYPSPSPYILPNKSYSVYSQNTAYVRLEDTSI